MQKIANAKFHIKTVSGRKLMALISAIFDPRRKKTEILDHYFAPKFSPKFYPKLTKFGGSLVLYLYVGDHLFGAPGLLVFTEL